MSPGIGSGPEGRAQAPAEPGGSRRADWAAWAAGRLLLIAIILEWIPWAEQFNDLQIYADWVEDSLIHGRYPTDDLWQYPPLAGPVLLIGAALPGDRLGFVLVLLAFDAAVMAMVDHRARSTRRPSGRRLWAAAPLVVGPLLLARFDVVPTALAVGALMVAARPFTSGALAAVGTWLKVWPALVVLGLRRAHLPRAVAGAVTASAVIVAILAITTTDPLSFLTGQRDRGLQVESVAALPYLIARMLGMPVSIVYRYGAHEIDASGVGVVAAVCALATPALIALVAVQRLRGRLEEIPPADVALAAVLFTVVTSRVFSGQYFIWLLGLSALSLADRSTRMRTAVRLVVAAGLATHLVYPWLYSALLEASPIAVAVQALRVGLTVLATVAAARVIIAPRQRPQLSGSPPSSRMRRRSADRSHPHDDSTH